MRPDQLTYLHLFARELGGMSFALAKAQERDDHADCVAILVDIHINLANAVKVLGISREDFLAKCKTRLQSLDDRAKFEHMFDAGGQVLLSQKKDPA